MSDAAPPPVPDGAAGQPGPLSPEDVAAALADLAAWLNGQSAPPPAPPEAAVLPGSGVDLHALLSAFTALRHEVNLQTRAARDQRDQAAAALDELRRALETLRQTQGPAAQEERQRPLLKALVELHDAAARAGRETQRVADAVRPLLEQAPPTPLDIPTPEEVPEAAAPSGWARWFGARPHQGEALAALRRRLAAAREAQARAAEERRAAAEAAERARQLLASLAEGHALSLRRVERALREHGLTPIEAAGRPYDPERMEAVEAVIGSGRPAGEVVEVVRPGYLWNGRVFRFAQVRVAKG
jgi:molecular chaperone GrpE